MLRRVHFLIPLLIIASCRSISSVVPGPEDLGVANLDSKVQAEQQQSQLSGVAEVETVGSGSIRLAMILPPGGRGSQADAFRNGAVMANNDLAGGQLTLEMVKVPPSPADIGPLFKKFQNDGVVLISVPGDATYVNQATNFADDGGPPVLALGNVGKSKVFDLLPTRAESLANGVSYLASRGTIKAVAATSQGTPDSEVTLVKNALGDDDEFLGAVTHPVDANSLQRIASADVLVLMGTSREATALARRLKRDRRRFGHLLRVGHEDWPLATIRNPVHHGTIIARRDTSGLNLISKRYRSKYKSPISPSAAYAYDLVAMVAGIARNKPGAKPTLKDLRRPAGFRGTTGTFRLRKSGKVERLYDITQIRSGNLEVLQRVEGF